MYTLPLSSPHPLSCHFHSHPSPKEQCPMMNFYISMLNLTSSRGLKILLYTKNGLLRACSILPFLSLFLAVDMKENNSLFVIRIVPQRQGSHPPLPHRRRSSPPLDQHYINLMSAIMSDPVLPVPKALVKGVPMLKISSKKMKQVIMKLHEGCITWAGSSNSRG